MRAYKFTPRTPEEPEPRQLFAAALLTLAEASETAQAIAYTATDPATRRAALDWIGAPARSELYNLIVRHGARAQANATRQPIPELIGPETPEGLLHQLYQQLGHVLSLIDAEQLESHPHLGYYFAQIAAAAGRIEQTLNQPQEVTA